MIRNLIPFPGKPRWGEIGVGDRVYHRNLGSAVVLEIISQTNTSYKIRARNSQAITLIADFQEFRILRKAGLRRQIL